MQQSGLPQLLSAESATTDDAQVRRDAECQGFCRMLWLFCIRCRSAAYSVVLKVGIRGMLNWTAEKNKSFEASTSVFEPVFCVH
jgi:hypothetical protein